ncbi:hypothetical protein LZ32DRAFT_269312 [Colletotrichum eremochloae]|nr:hypothetical protein LZ32DRAFT_269312 [Colletotrichum eremochloae]
MQCTKCHAARLAGIALALTAHCRHVLLRTVRRVMHVQGGGEGGRMAIRESRSYTTFLYRPCSYVLCPPARKGVMDRLALDLPPYGQQTDTGGASREKRISKTMFYKFVVWIIRSLNGEGPFRYEGECAMNKIVAPPYLEHVCNSHLRWSSSHPDACTQINSSQP